MATFRYDFKQKQHIVTLSRDDFVEIQIALRDRDNYLETVVKWPEDHPARVATRSILSTMEDTYTAGLRLMA